MSAAFAENRLTSEEFTHGPIYPLLASIFLRLGFNGNPFPILGIGMMSLSVSWLLSEIRQQKLATSRNILLAFTLATATSPTTRFILEGASNTISAALICSSIALSLSSRTKVIQVVCVAALGSLCLGTRYVDPILLAPLLFPSVLRLRKTDFRVHSTQKKVLISFILSAGIIIYTIFTLINIQAEVLGSWNTTPYDSKLPATSRIYGGIYGEDPTSQIKERDLSKVYPRLYQTLVNQEPYIHQYEKFDQKTLFQAMPYIVLFPTGLYLLWIRKPIIRWQLASICISFIIWASFYSTGWAFTAHDIYYGCLRYISGWSLCIGLVSIYALSFKRKVDLAPTAVFILALLCTSLAYRAWDRFSRVPSNFRLDYDGVVHRANTDYSNKHDRNHLGVPEALVYSDRIEVISDTRNRFKRVEIEVPSSLDRYFPGQITLDSHDINEANSISLSRENHIWVIKSSKSLTHLLIKTRQAGREFGLYSLSTFRY